jgi:hypothetical protein
MRRHDRDVAQGPQGSYGNITVVRLWSLADLGPRHVAAEQKVVFVSIRSLAAQAVEIVPGRRVVEHSLAMLDEPACIEERRTHTKPCAGDALQLRFAHRLR